MNIAICDDNKEALSVLSLLVKEAGEAKDTKINIECYSSGIKLIEEAC